MLRRYRSMNSNPISPERSFRWISCSPVLSQTDTTVQTPYRPTTPSRGIERKKKGPSITTSLLFPTNMRYLAPTTPSPIRLLSLPFIILIILIKHRTRRRLWRGIISIGPAIQCMERSCRRGDGTLHSANRSRCSR